MITQIRLSVAPGKAGRRLSICVSTVPGGMMRVFIPPLRLFPAAALIPRPALQLGHCRQCLSWRCWLAAQRLRRSLMLKAVAQRSRRKRRKRKRRERSNSSWRKKSALHPYCCCSTTRSEEQQLNCHARCCSKKNSPQGRCWTRQTSQWTSSRSTDQRRQ